MRPGPIASPVSVAEKLGATRYGCIVVTSEVVVEGIPLSQLAAASGPFLTCYLQIGGQTRARLESALSELSDISNALAAAARTLCPDSVNEGAVCLVANPTGPGAVFQMADPITMDVFRVGTVPSLGSLVESTLLLPSHAIITVSETDYSLASFGSIGVPSSDLTTVSNYESSAELLSALGFREAEMMIVVARGDAADDRIESLIQELAASHPDALVTRGPRVGAGVLVESIADEVVVDAASLRAEMITMELGRFRAARAEGAVVEGFDVLDAINKNQVSSILVHDDPDDHRTIGADRIVDLVTSAALIRKLQITMIPDVPTERGPRGGIGAILAGDATVAAVAEPEEAVGDQSVNPEARRKSIA